MNKYVAMNNRPKSAMRVMKGNYLSTVIRQDFSRPETAMRKNNYINESQDATL